MHQEDDAYSQTPFGDKRAIKLHLTWEKGALVSRSAIKCAKSVSWDPGTASWAFFSEAMATVAAEY